MITIHGRSGPFSARVNLPASKSISNRLLVLKYFAGDKLDIRNLSTADDTILLLTTIERIDQYRSSGATGLLRIDTRNAGTVMRFLTSLLAVVPGHFLLTGSARMLERPVGPLVEALRTLGADIEHTDRNGYPPLLIRGRKLTGGETGIETGISSQFVSSLMLIGPFLQEGLIMKLHGSARSWPYALMTLKLLKQIGVNYSLEDHLIQIKPWKPVSCSLEAEPDWSSAAFWYALVALAGGGEVLFPGLRRSGLQGDERAAELFKQLGVETVEDDRGTRIVGGGPCAELLEADLTACPDLVLPVAVSCAGLRINAVLTGVESLRIKESDRILALTEELRKIKLSVIAKEDRIIIDTDSGPRHELCHYLPAFDHSDHRVAMSLACLAAAGIRVDLNHEDVVGKSYPGFWKDLQSAGFRCSFHVDKI